MRDSFLLEVLLMVFLSAVERRGGFDLGDDITPVNPASPQRFLRSARRSLLSRIVEEDHRSILLAEIRPLAVQRSGIVYLPKYFEQIIVGNYRRVICHLDDFGMSGAAGADLLISGVLLETASIANLGCGHAGDLPECRFHTPKTTCSKRCLLHNRPLPRGLFCSFEILTARTARVNLQACSMVHASEKMHSLTVALPATTLQECSFAKCQRHQESVGEAGLVLFGGANEPVWNRIGEKQ